MGSMYRTDMGKIAKIAHLLEQAAPWLLLCSFLLVFVVFVIGRNRIRKALLDFPIGEVALGFGFFLQLLALAGVWGAAYLPS